MIRRMLDILVCPFDKESELELYELHIKKYDKTDENISQSSPTDVTKAHEKNKSDVTLSNLAYYHVIIEEGILFCNSCCRFYPIVEEIPIILPDELRDKVMDLVFLKKWSKSLPEKVLKKALPWHL